MQSVDPQLVEQSCKKVSGWLSSLPGETPPSDQESGGRPSPSASAAGSDLLFALPADEEPVSSPFRERSQLRRTVSNVVHRFTKTTSKSDEDDLSKVAYELRSPHLDDQFRSACHAFSQEVLNVERQLLFSAHDPVPARDAISGCLDRLPRLFAELQEAGFELRDKNSIPVLKYLKGQLLQHRRSHRLTSHDLRLIKLALGDRMPEQLDQEVVSAHATYMRLKGKLEKAHAACNQLVAPDSGVEQRSRSMPVLRRTESVAAQTAGMPDRTRALPAIAENAPDASSSPKTMRL